MKANFQDVIAIYEKEISKNLKNKKRVYNFEINKMQNISNIMDMLQNNDIGHNKYNIFLIYEPKMRLVMSLTVKDKIINHYLTRHILEPKLTKYLDPRNIATRKDMGTSLGIKLIKKYLVNLKNKYSQFYILKIDIKKYFYNIDHNILKNILNLKLNKDEFELIKKVIDSTNNSYINARIKQYINKYHIDIPIYSYGKGLPIGNMTSQFLSIFYLYKLDHYIVHNLKLKYYVRYMDDFVIMHNDLNYLKECQKIIAEKLKKEYLLDINEKKTYISNSQKGFTFLGYTYKVIHNKVIIKVARSNREKVKKKLKEKRYEVEKNIINYNKIFSSIMNYSYSYKYGKEKIINMIDRYFYYEK